MILHRLIITRMHKILCWFNNSKHVPLCTIIIATRKNKKIVSPSCSLKYGLLVYTHSTVWYSFLLKIFSWFSHNDFCTSIGLQYITVTACVHINYIFTRYFVFLHWILDYVYIYWYLGQGWGDGLASFSLSQRHIGMELPFSHTLSILDGISQIYYTCIVVHS